MHLIMAVLCQNRASGISPPTNSVWRSPVCLSKAVPRSVLYVTAEPSPPRVSVNLTHHHCFNTHHEKHDFSIVTLHQLV